MSDKFGMPIIVVSEESKVKSAITEYRDERDQLRAELDAMREKVKELEATVEYYKAQQIGLQNINIMNQATMEAELAAATHRARKEKAE